MSSTHHEHRENPESVPIWACRHKQVGASDVRFPLRGRGQKGVWGGHAVAWALPSAALPGILAA